MKNAWPFVVVFGISGVCVVAPYLAQSPEAAVCGGIVVSLLPSVFEVLKRMLSGEP